MSFQQGLSGLATSAKNLDVIGNNVSNANTIGFKMSQAQFADAYTSAQGTSTNTVTGIGSKLVTVAQQFAQGSVNVSSNPLDMAITGQGFFQVERNGETVYTRNGQFQFDRDGFIVTAAGHKVTGYRADPKTGKIAEGQTGPIQLSTQAVAPNATTKSSIGMNLDSREPVPPVAEFDPNDPSSYNRATALDIFDSLGNPHVMHVYFQKSSTPGTWNTYATVDNKPLNAAATAAAAAAAPAEGAAAAPAEGAEGAAAAPGAEGAAVPGTPVSNGKATFIGTISYDTAGKMLGTSPASKWPGVLEIPGGVTYGNGSTTPQPLTLDLNDSTQFGTPFGVTSVTQDGYTSGQLNGFTTGADGTVIGRYTNGQSKALGRIVLANFSNPQGLQPVGDNEWRSTTGSGSPVVGTAGTGLFGDIQSGAVEDSNVDLTSELVNMIMAQRVYQANAQTIKTQDSILQTITNIR